MRVVDPGSTCRALGPFAKTLERMRNAGSGPRFAKAGKKILYRLHDVEAWLEERSFSSTAEAKQGAGELGPGDAHQRRRDLDFRNTAQLALRSAPHLVSRWLPDGRLLGNEWVARNPRRSDRNAGSFKVNNQDRALGRFRHRRSRWRSDRPAGLPAWMQPGPGSARHHRGGRPVMELPTKLDLTSNCTLEAYAAHKALPIDFLRSLGCETVPNPYQPNRWALAIPYRARDGAVHRVRIPSRPAKGR